MSSFGGAREAPARWLAAIKNAVGRMSPMAVSTIERPQGTLNSLGRKVFEVRLQQ